MKNYLPTHHRPFKTEAKITKQTFEAVDTVERLLNPKKYTPTPNFQFTALEQFVQDGRVCTQGLPPKINIVPEIVQSSDLSWGIFRFDQTTGFLWMSDKKGDRKICNFYLAFTKRILIVTLKDTEEQVRATIFSNGCNGGTYTSKIDLPIKNVANFYDLLRKKYPQFYIFADNVKSSQYFAQYVSERYAAALKNLTTEKIFSFSGWYEDNGIMQYLSGLSNNCISKRILADVSQINVPEICHQTLGILNIAPVKIMLPLYLQLHLGFTMALFEKANRPAQYILALIGATGSRKTALAKFLYCNFDVENVVNFTATDRGLELAFEQCHDAVAVLDDFSSARDKSQITKLERVLRQVGDSSGRVKSTNGGRNIERADMRFALVLTAESPLTSLQQSSQLRNLVISIDKNSVNNEILRQYQREKTIAKLNYKFTLLEKYLSCYIDYLEKNHHQIIEKIISFETPILNLKFARQQELYQILSCQISIIANFYADIGMDTEGKLANYFQNTCLPVLQNIFLENQFSHFSSDPLFLFTKALSEMVARREILVANNRSEFEHSSNAMIGFWDKQFLKIIPNLVYGKVSEYYRHIGIKFAVTSVDIFSLLLNNKISEGYNQKNHKAKLFKKIKINNVNLDILCINWQNLEEFLRTYEVQNE